MEPEEKQTRGEKLIEDVDPEEIGVLRRVDQLGELFDVQMDLLGERIRVLEAAVFGRKDPDGEGKG